VRTGSAGCWRAKRTGGHPGCVGCRRGSARERGSGLLPNPGVGRPADPPGAGRRLSRPGRALDLWAALPPRPAARAGRVRARDAGPSRRPLEAGARLVGGDHRRLRSGQPALRPPLPPQPGAPDHLRAPAHRRGRRGGLVATGPPGRRAARGGGSLVDRTGRIRLALGISRSGRLCGPPGSRPERAPRPKPLWARLPLLRRVQLGVRVRALRLWAERSSPGLARPAGRGRSRDVRGLRDGHRRRSLAAGVAGRRPLPGPPRRRPRPRLAADGRDDPRGLGGRLHDGGGRLVARAAPRPPAMVDGGARHRPDGQAHLIGPGRARLPLVEAGTGGGRRRRRGLSAGDRPVCALDRGGDLRLQRLRLSARPALPHRLAEPRGRDLP
jgi:hypothetical protein